MGSMSRFSAIERLINVFEHKILSYFLDLVGMTIGKLGEGDVSVEYWVGAGVPLTGLSEWEGVDVHFRWASEEEVNSGKEMDGSTFTEFNEFIAGNKITSISIDGMERDDEVYLFAKFDENSSLEIPLGFNPETCEFSGYLEEILTEEKRKWFVENYGGISA